MPNPTGYSASKLGDNNGFRRKDKSSHLGFANGTVSYGSTGHDLSRSMDSSSGGSSSRPLSKGRDGDDESAELGLNDALLSALVHDHGTTRAENRNKGGVDVTKNAGSTGTLSTLTSYFRSSSSSSSSSSASSSSAAGNGMQSMCIDFDSMSSGGGSGACLSSPSNSSSDDENDDLSSREADDEYGLLKKKGGHRLSQRKDAALKTFEDAYLTLTNLKVVISFLLWYVTYMIMGVIGGSIAFMHFPRTDKVDGPDPLPDFGHALIPYWCPAIPNAPHGNVQSVVLLFLYAILFGGVVLRWRPRVHPRTGKVWGGDGRLILQQLCHLNCLVFLTRTSTVVMTGLPQPNPKCVSVQHDAVTYVDAIKFVVGRGFPPHACGDLIYSGHVGCTLMCMAVLTRHGFLRRRAVRAVVWAVAFLGIYCTISCRSHYTVDVVLAFYFGYFLPEFYFSRSESIIGGRVSRWIRWLEVSPEKGNGGTPAVAQRQAKEGRLWSEDDAEEKKDRPIIVDV